MKNIDINKWLKERLSEERYLHSLGAEKVARDLAVRFGSDPNKAALAALLHDNAKCLSNSELLNIIKENNLDVSELEMNSYKTLHSPVSAFLAKKELGINDDEILSAIRWHTLGKVNMTILEKIVFLADKIEPYTRDESFSKKVLNTLDLTNGLDEAILVCYDATIKSLVDRRLFISPQTIEVWNSLISMLK